MLTAARPRNLSLTTCWRKRPAIRLNCSLLQLPASFPGSTCKGWIFRGDSGTPYANGNKKHKTAGLASLIADLSVSDAVIIAGSQASNNAVSLGLYLAQRGVRPWLGIPKRKAHVAVHGNTAVSATLYGKGPDARVIELETSTFESLASPGPCWSVRLQKEEGRPSTYQMYDALHDPALVRHSLSTGHDTAACGAGGRHGSAILVIPEGAACPEGAKGAADQLLEVARAAQGHDFWKLPATRRRDAFSFSCSAPASSAARVEASGARRVCVPGCPRMLHVWMDCGTGTGAAAMAARAAAALHGKQAVEGERSLLTFLAGTESSPHRTVFHVVDVAGDLHAGVLAAAKRDRGVAGSESGSAWIPCHAVSDMVPVVRMATDAVGSWRRCRLKASVVSTSTCSERAPSTCSAWAAAEETPSRLLPTLPDLDLPVLVHRPWTAKSFGAINAGVRTAWHEWLQRGLPLDPVYSVKLAETARRWMEGFHAASEAGRREDSLHGGPASFSGRGAVGPAGSLAFNCDHAHVVLLSGGFEGTFGRLDELQY